MKIAIVCLCFSAVSVGCGYHVILLSYTNSPCDVQSVLVVSEDDQYLPLMVYTSG